MGHSLSTALRRQICGVVLLASICNIWLYYKPVLQSKRTLQIWITSSVRKHAVRVSLYDPWWSIERPHLSNIPGAIPHTICTY